MPLTSFYTALTGINNNATAINVIGDNLANMNTTAFKSGQASFSELLSGVSGTSATGNPNSTGVGAMVNSISRSNTQGTINNTGESTDAAINGNGFFIVQTGTGTCYTRSGSFEINKDGYLISADGFNVMGYPATDGKVDTTASIAPLVVNLGKSVAGIATKNLSISANLDAEATEGTAFATTVKVYDSLGAAHDVKLTFAKTADAGSWSWSATMAGADTGSNTPVELQSGIMAFDSNGKLTDPTTNPDLTITGLVNGAADMTISFNLTDKAGNGLITSYASNSAVASSMQDGSASSVLTDINITSSGMIMGKTDSGQSIALGQLAIANFQNVDGLQKFAGSTFSASTSAGEASIGTAGTGGRGSIVGSSLEQSNVDMAEEFTNLIVAQRAYQANSKVITATNELYQDALNLVR